MEVHGDIVAAIPISGWARTNCPHCPERVGREDTSHAMSVSDSGYYECHRCGVRGWAKKRLQPRPVAEKVVVPSCVLPEGSLPLYGPSSKVGKLNRAKRYLMGRLGDATGRCIRLGDLHATTGHGKHRNRIVAPLKKGGELVGWVARDYSGFGKPKYLNFKGMPRELWNGDVVDHEWPYLLVVEGVFDALRYLPNVVACLGKPSRAQKERLLDAKCPIIVAGDGDISNCGRTSYLTGRGQQHVAASLVDYLKVNRKEAYHLPLPPGQDPGSMDPGWLKRKAQALVQTPTIDGPNPGSPKRPGVAT